MCLARFDGTQRAAHNLLINRREFIAGAGKEPSDHGEAVPNAGGARRPQSKGLTPTRKTIESFGVGAFPPDRPQRIAEVLFDERYLGLDCKHYLLQIRLRATIFGHSC